MPSFVWDSYSNCMALFCVYMLNVDDLIKSQYKSAVQLLKLTWNHKSGSINILNKPQN